MPSIKLEIHMPISELVRLRDVLADELRHDTRARYVVTQIEQKLEDIACTYIDTRLVPNEHEQTLARRGERIQAIRTLRERTGAGLKAAKDAVDRAVPFVKPLVCRYCQQGLDTHTGCGPTH